MASFNRLFVGNCLLFLVAALHAQTAHYSGAQSTLPSNATNPFGVAVDAGGNVWVVDNFSGSVTEVTPSGASYTGPYAVLGGFNGPYGIAIDTHGNIYITEDGVGEPVNDVIKETYDGGHLHPEHLTCQRTQHSSRNCGGYPRQCLHRRYLQRSHRQRNTLGQQLHPEHSANQLARLCPRGSRWMPGQPVHHRCLKHPGSEGKGLG